MQKHGPWQRSKRYHKPDGRPAALQHRVRVPIDGVDCVVLGGGGAVVGSAAGGQDPEMVAVQVEWVLLCAVTSGGAVRIARCSADTNMSLNMTRSDCDI